MAKAPQEPTVEKGKITETLPDGTTRPVPWLPKLMELFTPFFRETAAALGGQLTLRENLLARVFDQNRVRITAPDDDFTPLNLFYDLGGMKPALVFVVAEPIVDNGAPADSMVQPIVEWMPATQDGKAGVRIVRLRGLTSERRYDLAVTVLGG